MASLDATFSSHAVLTVMHIIPAAIFMRKTTARATGLALLEG